MRMQMKMKTLTIGTFFNYKWVSIFYSIFAGVCEGHIGHALVLGHGMVYANNLRLDIRICTSRPDV